MTTITLSSNAAISAWQTSTSNADRVVSGITLTGTAAAAYHFGEALRTVKFQGLLDGVQLTDGRFEFPPASDQWAGGQWVSLSEVADALHYKYGVDPLIEFAPGFGLRGYSVADINAVLERLNQEFKGQFNLLPISSSTVASVTQSTFESEKSKSPVVPTATATGSTDEYLTFATDPNWSTGTPVRVDASVGGLFTDTDYYLRNLGGGNYSVFTTQSAASGTSTTGRVNLTDNVTASVSYSPPRFTAAHLSDEWVQFSTDPAWLTGTSVRVSASGGGLSANMDYFVRNLGGGKYSFFTTSAASAGTGTTGRVDLSTGIQNTTTASFSVDTTNRSALASLLDTTSTAALASATEAELRQNLTEGGDLYVDRRGAFFINGVPTTAKDVAVVSRLLAQDNISSEYKVLMDDYTERNNLITAARTVLDGGLASVTRTTDSLSQTYGYGDVLSELTSGQYSDDTLFYWKTDLANDEVTFDIDPAWVSGTRVRIDKNTGGEAVGSGLKAGTDYYVRNLDDGAYSFFLSQPDATGTSTSNRVNLTGLVDRTALVQVQDSTPVAPAGNVINVNLIPGTFSGNALQTYNPMQYATITNGSGGAKDDYIQFFPIAPNWPEDTVLEFSQNWGHVTAGQENYVANWLPQANGQNRVQLTPDKDGWDGGANDESNRATAQPLGNVMLYDTDSAATETWKGYTQFSLQGTNFTTGTAFTPNEDVNILVTHTNSSETLYKSVVSMKKGTTYYLRNDGDGKYSAYTSKTYAENADGRGKLFFAIDEKTEYAGTATRPPFITDQTATVWGISRGVTILGATSESSNIPTANLPKSEMTFLVDPLWANGTAVQTGATGGGLTAGVTYYTRKGTSGYSFYTSQAAALNNDSTGLVAVYEPTRPGNMFRLSDQGLELSSLSSDWDTISAMLNTLISNKVRDGDLDQAKLQTLTAQLQNNIEAMTAMIKVFSDLNATLVQALR